MAPAGKRRVMVLGGGRSAEREVSLNTARQIVSALDPERYDIRAIDTDDLPGLARLSPGERPDVVIIALHGPGGEDGTVQGFLDVLGIAYTGSGVMASALALDKVRAKAVLAAAGVPLPRQVVVERADRAALAPMADRVGAQLGWPVIVKPASQGSTYGLTVVTHPGGLLDAFDASFRYDETTLVEERLLGIELTVAVIGNEKLEALPVIEIVPKGDLFDYEAKYSADPNVAADEICPARVSDDVAAEAQRLSIVCHRALGCRGMSRTDMFLTDDGFKVLEVNTIPGMTATSLLPKAAHTAGISFSALMDRFVSDALEGRVT